MSQKQPPTTGVAIAWVGGAFVAWVIVTIGFVFAFFATAAIMTAAKAKAASVARNRAPGPGITIVTVPPRDSGPSNYTPPTYTPPTPGPTINNTPPTPPTPIPQPDPLHTSFTDIDDALKYIQSGKPLERTTAAEFLIRATPNPKDHDKMIAAARTMLSDESFRRNAIQILTTWSSKDDLPILREVFSTMLQQGMANNPGPNTAYVGNMMDLLTKLGDKDSAPAFAQCLKSAPVREKASETLAAMGPVGAAAVDPFVTDDDVPTAKAALAILTKVGTEKNIMAVYRAIYTKPQEISAPAESALKEIATRASLKPEQYLYLLLDHYTITPPANFKPDAKFSRPNARSWTRTAPNRSVVSSLTISVKLVPPNFQLTPIGDDRPRAVGALTFHQVDNPIFDNQRSSEADHFAAVDGEYLIDLVLTFDQRDTPGAQAIMDSINSIKAK